MNIAFPALFILLVAFPGLIFNWACSRFQGEALREIRFGMYTIVAALISIVFHLIGGMICDLVGRPINLIICLDLMKGVPLTGCQKQAIVDNIGFIVAYIYTICLAALIIGWLLKKYYLETLYEGHPLAFYSRWYYLFRGKTSECKGLDFHAVKLICLVEVNNGTYLYQGFVNKFYFRRGELDSLDIVWAKKCKADGQKQNDDTHWYNLDGRRLTLKASSIVNYSVEYVKLDDE